MVTIKFDDIEDPTKILDEIFPSSKLEDPIDSKYYYIRDEDFAYLALIKYHDHLEQWSVYETKTTYI